MKDGNMQINLEARVAWWVVPYLRCVALFAYIMGKQPDLHKVKATMLRGVKVKVIR